MSFKSKFKKTALYTSLLLSPIISTSVYNEYFSEKVNSQEDLIRIVKEEEPLARKDSVTRTIYWMYGDTPWGTAASQKIREGEYKIVLDSKKDRNVIRHELYHVYASHCDRAFDTLKWDTWDKIKDEFTANCYAYYGWRL